METHPNQPQSVLHCPFLKTSSEVELMETGLPEAAGKPLLLKTFSEVELMET